MIEMIERVARAICAAAGVGPDDPAKNWRGTELEIPAWKQWENEARAAIAAMRDITPEMEDLYPPFVQKEEFMGSYRAMIDAALKGSSTNKSNPSPKAVQGKSE